MLNGALVSWAGVRMNADILTLVWFQNTQAAITVWTGLRSVGNGWITASTYTRYISFRLASESGHDELSDHTGIVQKVENGRVYTVEGNSVDSVRINQYSVGYYEILGYGIPCFKELKPPFEWFSWYKKPQWVQRNLQLIGGLSLCLKSAYSISGLSFFKMEMTIL